jgi:Ankyrin repeats (3 copies)
VRGLRAARREGSLGEGSVVTDAPPQLDPEQVQAFVASSHGDFDAVQSLLAEEPRLVNAAWDWGGGDWETALGAASHMGRRQIALFLLEHGARLDLFAAAMLGYVDVVRAMLAEHPELRDAKGAHGIPLVVHAQQGGEQAKAVLELLEAS